MNLGRESEQVIRDTCMRGESDVIIRAGGGLDSLAQAWTEVGDLLTVSERIEQDGESISGSECKRLLRKYMKLDDEHSSWNRLKQRYWIRYLWRRCGILASSEKFNKNKDFPEFGSTTMEVMLDEVENALAEQLDWNESNHEQLVYSKQLIEVDGVSVVDYEWSVLATNPDATDPGWTRRKALLSSLKMHPPTKADLDRPDRRVMDAYLANGLGIELEDLRDESSTSGAPFDFCTGTLRAIDNEEFVLTLDFMMKMLCMNERIECRVPCIMEGETGVSKTALTRMLFHLKNSPPAVATGALSIIAETVQDGVRESQNKSQSAVELTILRKLADLWEAGGLEVDANVWSDASILALKLCSKNVVLVAESLLTALREDPGLDPLADSSISADVIRTCVSSPEECAKLLTWFVGQHADGSVMQQSDWAFQAVDVHAALTPRQVADHPVSGVNVISSRAQRLKELGELLDSSRHRQATICMFFDEINTSSCMGVFKELLIDHSIDGQPLPDNLVIVAACNPARSKFDRAAGRREELGNTWAIGHYQVHPLPASMQQMVWDYGSLEPSQEREFIQKRLRYFHPALKAMSGTKFKMLADLIDTSQQKTRAFAKEHIRASSTAAQKLSDRELSARASSSVSLRDILRVIKLFEFFASSSEEVSTVLLGDDKSLDELHHGAMLLAIAVVYYLRFGTDEDLGLNFRRKFRIHLESEFGLNVANVDSVLRRSTASLMQQTRLDPGIADTRGLQENVFMVVVCCLAQVPFMIVGPPGSSKTLAVTVVDENARGQYSKSEFYKAVPNMVPFRYQCSRRSTSNEIELVFERAIDRQLKANVEGGNSLSFVFMDEAGLPEEGRESLKVLHYYLEEHKKVSARVGFVAISNHLLDAAKSNRCALLTRAKADQAELLEVARGCIGNAKERKKIKVSIEVNPKLGIDETRLLLDSKEGGVGLLDLLCETYDACASEKYRPWDTEAKKMPPTDFVVNFGLRDFMHLIKLIGRTTLCRNNTLSTSKLIHSLQRNMNGLPPDETSALLRYFMDSFQVDEAALALRNPVELMREAVSELGKSDLPVSRYVLVIGTTVDDSILRALRSELTTDGAVCQVLKLSRFPEDNAVQQINVISQVKWAAEKGEAVILSEAESTNESFYDLFNQALPALRGQAERQN